MSISLTHWWFCHIQAARQTVRQTDTGTKIKSERGGGGEIGSEGDRDKKFSNTRNKKSSDACEHIVSDVTWSSFSGVRSFSTSDSLAQATQPVRVALACPQGSHLHIQNHLKALSAASVMFLFLMALLIFAPSMPNAERLWKERPTNPQHPTTMCMHFALLPCTLKSLSQSSYLVHELLPSDPPKEMSAS